MNTFYTLFPTLSVQLSVDNRLNYVTAVHVCQLLFSVAMISCKYNSELSAPRMLIWEIM